MRETAVFDFSQRENKTKPSLEKWPKVFCVLCQCFPHFWKSETTCVLSGSIHPWLHPRTTESESLWGGSYNINRHLLWWWYAVRLGIPCSRWYLVSLPPMKLVEQWKFGWRASVQSLSHIRLFATLRTAARQASLSITNSWSLLKLMSIELMSSNQWASERGWIHRAFKGWLKVEKRSRVSLRQSETYF